MTDTNSTRTQRAALATPPSTDARRGIVFYVALVMVALLHVLVNLVSTEAGLRISIGDPIALARSTVRFALSDPILVIVLAVIVVDWLSSGFRVPHARLRLWWLWLLVLSVWMALSLVVGRVDTGEWIRWAYLNKGFGWLVLLAYFIAGLWIADRGRAWATPALATFIAMAWFASAVGLVGFIIYVLFPGLTEMQRFIRPQGLAANPNAFAISIAAAIVLQLPLMAARTVFSTWWARFGLALMALALVYAGSRSAWLGIAAGLLVLAAFRQIPYREVVIAAVLAGLINITIVDLPVWTKKQIAVRSESPSVAQSTSAPRRKVRDPYTYVTRRNVLRDIGLNSRVLTMRDAIDDWREQPIWGIGLGGFLWRHSGADDPLRGIQIHTTPLWLLVETGIVGILLFAAFFYAVLRALLRRDRRWEGDPALIGIAAALIVVAAASIGTEILYQRYLWFLAGLGLAWPGLGREHAGKSVGSQIR